jgi:HAMP domain-containing protein
MHNKLDSPNFTKCDWCNAKYRIGNYKSISIGISKARCKKCNRIFTVRLTSDSVDHYPRSRDGIDNTQTNLGKYSVDDKNIDYNSNERSLTVTKSQNRKSESIPIKIDKIKYGIRKKFNTALTFIMIISLCGTYIASSHLFKQSAEHRVIEDARFLLDTMEASRSFTGEVLKPALYKELPGRFIVEGMSSSFGARNIFERINNKYPEYYFKHAAPDPRNQLNLADDFEISIIEEFKKNPNKKEWYGYRSNRDGKNFVIMKPIVAEQRCMKCHSVPSRAPVEVLDRYGSKAAFGMVVGDVVAALTVYVPATKIFSIARNNTIILNTIIALCFITLITIINIFFAKIVIKPIQILKESVNEISIGNVNVPIESKGNDEISDLAQAFERMRISICLAIQRVNSFQEKKDRKHNLFIN